jgi:hypothetical protein
MTTFHPSHLTDGQKRAVIDEVNRFRTDCGGPFKYALHALGLPYTYPQVLKWKAQLAEKKAQPLSTSVAHAIALFDQGYSIEAAADHHGVSAKAVVTALRQRGRQPSTTPHIRAGAPRSRLAAY